MRFASQSVAQTLGHLAQQLVAGFVAQGLVERFEVVEIEEQQRPMTSAIVAQNLPEVFENGYPVRQAGELVIESELADTRLRLLLFGDGGGELFRH